MERLTIDKAINDFRYYAKQNMADLDTSYAKENNQIADWLEELKDYKATNLTPEQMIQIDKDFSVQAKELHDWQENGIKFPCKAGNTVWIITHPYSVTKDEDDWGKKEEIFEAKCSSVTVFKASMQYRFIAGGRRIVEFFTDSSFGKTVFLTQEEAEAKLKEMEGI